MKFDKELIYSTSEERGGHAYNTTSVAYYWQGGIFGAKRNWCEPMNWYNRSVPGWFDTVVISDEHTVGNNFPIVEAFANDIAQLIIEPGSKLTIGLMGRLSVDGMLKKKIGILNEGDLIIDGELTVHRTLCTNVRNDGLIFNNGSFAIDKNEKRGLKHSFTGRFENFGDLLFL